MTLLQFIRLLEGVAAKQPAVNTIVRNDVFRLNAAPDARYGVFAWLQGEHVTDAASGFVTYNFTLFYVDRLTADKGNEIEVQSVGLETLENIIKTLQEAGVFPSTYTFRTFNQRFADECAGVFANVAIDVPKGGPCAEEYQYFQPWWDESAQVWRWETIDKKVTIIQ